MTFRNIAHAVTVATLALACAVVAAPIAGATGGQYVKTQSGKVQCVVYANYPGTSPSGTLHVPPGSIAMCESTRDGGFRQAGYSLAVVDSGGNFSFQCCANLVGSAPVDFLTMNYGQSYNLNGWTIAASEDGTTFTNNATGHGMFVSMENVYGF